MSIVACLQMCSTPCPGENLKQAEKLLMQAADQGADLVVLPEMFGCMSSQQSALSRIQEPLGQGAWQNFLSKSSRRYGLWVIGGTVPIQKTSTHYTATTFVFDQNGKTVGRYDKIHLFDAHLSADEYYCESNSVFPGSEIVTVDTPVGRVGLAVCFDIRFASLFVEYAKHKVDLIAIPAAFTTQTGQDHWDVLTRSRALDCQCYLAAATQWGQHDRKRATHGSSRIIDPWGTVLSQTTNSGEGVVTATIDPAVIKHIREKLPVVQR